MTDITAPVLVTDDATLRSLCAEWAGLPFLALDTEFIRVNTFFPILGLLQVCDNQRSYLLDPLSITDWSAFSGILAAPGITKVLHSCSEDLVVFNEFFKLVPEPVFDTQRAAAYLNLGFSLSYQNLVRTLLKIDVPKGETRSDWLRRPLSKEQLVYAALDVAWLPEVYRLLYAQLEQRGRLAWFEEDCRQMRGASTAAEVEESWGRYYLGLGAAWRLNEEQLGALRELCRWREVQARRRNKPRSWIARDADLISLATALPASSSDLRAIADLPAPLLRRDGDQLLELVAVGRQQPTSLDVSAKPMSPELRKQLKQCQAAVRRKAAELDIAEEVLARKKHLVALLLNFREHGLIKWPEELGGWRREALEAALTPIITRNGGGQSDDTAG